MGDDKRYLDCCDKECRDKYFQKCGCDNDRNMEHCCRENENCDDDGGSIICLLILLLVLYCLFCNNSGRGGLFGGLF